ncbi:MAG TPA: sodium-translocating pyrophosphatase [archaeon]|nr:sodium-translocating pyrophosphatase [archaeon]
MFELPLIALAGIVTLIFAIFTAFRVLRYECGNEKMISISNAVQEGASAFLRKEYRFLTIFVIALAIILSVFISPIIAASFVIGAFLSALAGFFGMKIATKANVRTTNAARTSLNKALHVAFSSGTVMGLTVVSFGILGISVLYFIVGDPNLIIGFGFGASSIALFARVGGGIYTKAADVGADLVGKVEKGIPEDDPRNPATIADNVGDNVGDVAGMGADLFESYAGSIIAAMVIAFAAGMATNNVIAPLMIAAIGAISSIIGTFFVRVKSEDQGALLNALRRGIAVAAILTIVLSYFMISYLGIDIGIFYSILSGLIAGILIGLATEYYTSAKYKPTQDISASAQTGSGTVIIRGFAVGMQSTALPGLIIVAAILSSFYFGGLYGIAIAGIGMLSTLGITLATDAYGPVADNAGGIAEMSGLPKNVRNRTDALDSLGNTTAATGKGFAIGSAVLTSLALLVAYTNAVGITVINLIDATVIGGLIIGAIMPFVFSSMTMKAVGKSAFMIVNEVRRQFKTTKGLMEGKTKPDYARCVSIATQGALKEMIVPGLLAVIAPIIIGIILGPVALGGMLIGATITGFLLAVTMANAGGAWDNAKKYIESGKFGGKGSEAHKAAVVGDTVGDPMKDTSGPSINILIKLMSIVSLIFAPIFLALA